MKVLLCERNFTGHRKTYLKGLLKIQNIDFYLFTPENVGLDDKHFFEYKSDGELKTLSEYVRWIKQIRIIVKKYNIKTIHILDGDSIMKFFGLGFSSFGSVKIVITYHHYFSGFIRKISYLMMNHGKKRICIAHTNLVKNSLEKLGVKNIVLCQYPAFDFYNISKRDVKECKDTLHLSNNTPIIGIIGGMVSYKNIIRFLMVMRESELDFHILICGKEGDITEKELLDAVKPYSDKVTMIIRKLSDEEYETAVMASDIIYCIYGSEFDGASGPMTDGVCANKMILSCAHGSLGEIVESYHLGCTADCMKENEILEKTELALEKIKTFYYDNQAQAYKEELKPEIFQRRYKKVYFE